MLVLGLFIVMTAVSLPTFISSVNILFRTTSLIIFISAVVAINGLDITELHSGVSPYSGLLQVTTVSQSVDAFILLIGAIAITPWARETNLTSWVAYPTRSEQTVIVLFTSIGASLLISAADLVTLYLSLELQSFAVYVIAGIYRDSESSTAAGLKYYLLGGLSSSLLLLGVGIIYAITGLTNLEQLYALVSVGVESVTGPLAVGFTLISVGLLFKISSAPFHNWAPDVYDGVPTIITTWLAVLPKVSILAILLELQIGLGGQLFINVGNNQYDSWTSLFIVCSILSLLIGTIVGLAQVRIKRLLAYSTISHIGFMLLALAVNSEESLEAYILYVLQYTITALDAFLIVLAFGYTVYRQDSSQWNINDISYIRELAGRIRVIPALSAAIVVCLFSIAGVPPLAGFVAKASVLYSALHGGYMFIAIVAIIRSVISGSYYLSIIRVMAFEPINESSEFNSISIQSIHSFIISLLTLAVSLFIIQPALVLDSLQLLALSLYGN